MKKRRRIGNVTNWGFEILRMQSRRRINNYRHTIRFVHVLSCLFLNLISPFLPFPAFNWKQQQNFTFSSLSAFNPTIHMMVEKICALGLKTLVLCGWFCETKLEGRWQQRRKCLMRFLCYELGIESTAEISSVIPN